MCQSLAQGGQRCACSTRKRYNSLSVNDADWDAAAIEHASTSTGNAEMAAEVRTAAEAGDHDRAARIASAVRRGEALREANREAGAIMADMRATGSTGPGEWGSVAHVQEGSRTPWGEAQYVEHPASGIVSVGCSGHGGIKLSRERNQVIPPALRNSSGWYEEDCEAGIVGMYHPDAFPHYLGGDEARRADSEARVKNWFPDQYAQATGTPVDVSESSVLRTRAKQDDKEAFRAAHANEFVTLGSGDTHATWIPSGYAVTEARKDATGETRHYLVPKDTVIQDGSYGPNILINSAQAVDVTAVINAGKAPVAQRPLVQGEAFTIDYAALNDRARTAATNELGKRFRWSDGSVSSFGERLAAQGVRCKKETSGGYRVELADGSGYSLKKASFDALTSVPDATTDLDRTRIKQSRARTTMDRISTWDRTKKAAAEQRYLKATEHAQQVEARDKVENPLRYYEGIQSARQAAFDALVGIDKGLPSD